MLRSSYVTVLGDVLDLGRLDDETYATLAEVVALAEAYRAADSKGRDPLREARDLGKRLREYVVTKYPYEYDGYLDGPVGRMICDRAHLQLIDAIVSTRGTDVEQEAIRNLRHNMYRLLFDRCILLGVDQAKFAAAAGLRPPDISKAFQSLVPSPEPGTAGIAADRMNKAWEALRLVPEVGRLLLPKERRDGERRKQPDGLSARERDLAALAAWATNQIGRALDGGPLQEGHASGVVAALGSAMTRLLGIKWVRQLDYEVCKVLGIVVMVIRSERPEWKWESAPDALPERAEQLANEWPRTRECKALVEEMQARLGDHPQPIEKPGEKPPDESLPYAPRPVPKGPVQETAAAAAAAVAASPAPAPLEWPFAAAVGYYLQAFSSASGSSRGGIGGHPSRRVPRTQEHRAISAG